MQRIPPLGHYQIIIYLSVGVFLWMFHFFSWIKIQMVLIAVKFSQSQKISLSEGYMYYYYIEGCLLWLRQYEPNETDMSETLESEFTVI